MRRMLAPWALTLLALVGAGRASAEDSPDKILAGKGLRAEGETYVLRSEDDVRKASDLAEARLKDYRRAATLEKMSTKDAAGRKAMAAELTRRRAAMKQELSRTVPQIDAQVRMLTQRQAAMRQQLSGLQYGTSTIGAMAYNQLAGQHNALSDQIEALQLRSSQMISAYDTLGDQIEWLEGRRGSAEGPSGAKPASASPDEKRQAYVDALAALRKAVDETKQAYEALAGDAEVKAALESRNTRSTRSKYVLGPTRRFLSTARALDEAEAKVTAETILEEPKPPSGRKPRSVRGQ